MESMLAEWRKELVKAGLLKSDQEIENKDPNALYQNYQMERMKSLMQTTFSTQDSGNDSRPKREIVRPAVSENLRTATNNDPSKTTDFDIGIREGMKKGLDALLTVAKGANYCMFVIGRAWINFRYRKSKNNLHLQVACNKYISPVRLQDSDIKHLAKMGIVPEEGSIDILAREFDEEPRNLDKIVDTILEIFNHVYRVRDGASAYMELGLAKGENEELRRDIAQHFSSRDGKKFKFAWDARS